MVERTYRAVDAIAAIRSVNGQFPEYRRTTPDEWSRTVQSAFFGEEPETVFESEKDELMDIVRKMREWLKVNGHDASEHPDFCNTDHEIFWDETLISGEDGYPQRISVSAEPHAYEQQGARGLEHYPKFTFDDGLGMNFTLYFDQTYDLRVDNRGPRRFEIDSLPRDEMTRMEYALLRRSLVEAADAFGISISATKSSAN